MICLTKLSKDDIDNCVDYLIYGKEIRKSVVSNADWIGHVCADIHSREIGLTEGETI